MGEAVWQMRIYDFNGYSGARDERREAVQKRLSSPLLSAVITLAVMVALVEAVWGQNLTALWESKNASDPTGTEASAAMLHEPLPENNLGFASLLDISYTSAAYLDAEKTARAQLSDFMQAAYEDMQREEKNFYDGYSESIQEILDSIEAVEQLHVLTLSPLTDFEDYCDTYYRYAADYLASVQRNSRFTWEEYNALAVWLQETKDPYEKIKEIFDENSIPYSVRTEDDGSEYIVYTVSSIGTF